MSAARTLSAYKVFGLHLIFWLLYFSYRVFDIQKYVGMHKSVAYVGIPMAFLIISSYIHYFFILPIWINRKQFGWYAAALFGLLVIMVPIQMTMERWMMPSFNANSDVYYANITLARTISVVWDNLGFILFTGMIRFTINWFELENRKRELENEKLYAELNYLKAQINPHFLFNTLHNLNYLVYTGAANATEVIIKLSNIMRYMIYDASKDQVPLSREIAYMHDYIHLESIRLNRHFQMDFYVEGQPADVMVAPLILITFLENAFKHGVSDQEPHCWIKVTLRIHDQRLHYVVMNKKINTTRKLKSGFGLDNVQKRLRLSYPERHQLQVSDEGDIFTVDLTLHGA